MTLAQLLNQMMESGEITQFVNDNRANFAIRGKTYLGAQFLPLVPRDNMFREEGFDYVAPIAADGTRHSPVPLRGARTRTESLLVELGTNDAGAILRSDDFDALNKLLGQNNAAAAQAQILNFLTRTIVTPLVEVVEKQRWQALVDAQVVRLGDNDYREEVGYQNPTGFRVSVGQDWYDPQQDPFDSIFAMADKMSGEGFAPNAIVTSRRNVAILARHPLVRARALAGVEVNYSARVTTQIINDMLEADGLPPITIYNETYLTEAGVRVPFLRQDAFVLLSTDRIDPAQVDEVGVLEPTGLGYVGNGIPAGQASNGRVVFLRINDQQKAPTLEAEGTQETLPVIRNPHAVAVLNVPDETP